MKRVVIVSNWTDNDEGLIEFLNALFPECEIRIVSPNAESSVESPKSSLLRILPDQCEERYPWQTY